MREAPEHITVEIFDFFGIVECLGMLQAAEHTNLGATRKAPNTKY
jgi:hypothetical protein